MIQDISPHTLNNQYHPRPAADGDCVLFFEKGAVLLKKAEEGCLLLPCAAQLTAEERQELRYLFSIDETAYFLAAGRPAAEGFVLCSLRELRTLHSAATKMTCFAIMTGWHLAEWYANSRFCGRCGSATRHDAVERMMRCPHCGNMIFPRISPAVIAGVVNGDKILLSKYAGRGYTSFALLAGFTEIGETLEETVAREVMEEVGLRVKNIRYYKNQPWGMAGNLSVGFFCDLDGDDTITLDQNELALAEWYSRDELPADDDGYSVTREMIGYFKRHPEAF